MSSNVANGIAAIFLGTLVAVLLVVPTAAIRYRRRGSFGPGGLMTLLATSIYGLALWTYTLLPFPSGDDWTCKSPQLDPLGSFRPIWEGRHELDLIHNAAFMQIALNVLLFLPLGFLVRLISGRGVIVTTMLGGAISLLIETTQGTGDWGLFRCAYRLFDVDDLITNTAGAFIGGVLAWILIHRRHRTEYHLPTRITLGRRWMGFLCDTLVIVISGVGAVAVLNGWEIYAQDQPRGASAEASHLAQVLVPLLLESAAVLGTGRTVGEWAIAVRTTTGPIGRVVKLIAGVGFFIVIQVTDFRGSGWLLLAFVLATIVLSATTRSHRGLSGLLSRSELHLAEPTREASQ